MAARYFSIFCGRLCHLGWVAFLFFTMPFIQENSDRPSLWWWWTTKADNKVL